MNRQELIRELGHYETSFSEERYCIPRFISLLQNFKNCYTRELLTGHMTASAFIVNESGDSVLLTHHKKLNRWLQPGGHADGVEDIREVAFKEGLEETGLSSLTLFSNDFFDIDVHQIPTYKDIQAHFHYDIRFLFTADPGETLQISEESHNLAWIEIDQLANKTGNNRSILRMSEKLDRLFP